MAEPVRVPPGTFQKLEGSQEVEQVYDIGRGRTEPVVEILDDLIGVRSARDCGYARNGDRASIQDERFRCASHSGALTCGIGMALNGTQQVFVLSVVHQEETLAEAPERGRAELIRSRNALGYAVRQLC